jgi:glycosyltransferase involved in cell wall biosynthesis
MPNLSPSGGGPHIFGERLRQELINIGLAYTKDAPNQLNLIDGFPQEGRHNILRLDGLYFEKSHPQNQSIFRAHKDFDHIVFQGEFCRLQYEAFTGIIKSHSIIPNGVPDSFFETHQPAFKSELEKVLIASASWRRHKRIEEVIEAFKSPRLQDVLLVILGGCKGPELPNVAYLPVLPPHELPSYYQSADAMVHLAWLDWCPNTVVEGLASGLPVLCSHNGGTKELVKDDGIILELEEDYVIGTELDLYTPPPISLDLLIEGILQILYMPKIKRRNDLKINDIALKYSRVFT